MSLVPGVALAAPSTGCQDINSGVLNHISTVTGTGDLYFYNTAPADTFTAGEIINYTYTITPTHGAPGTRLNYRVGSAFSNLVPGNAGYATSSGSGSVTLPANTNRFSITEGDVNNDGSAGTITWSVTCTPVASSVATLSNLSLSAGALTPSFATSTFNYSASVPNSTSSIQVTPTTTDSGASVKVNGSTVTSGSTSAPIALAVGSNTVTTLVTAQNGTTTQTYTVTVTRAASPPSVSGVSPSSGPTSGGTSVTITGANFSGVTGVDFGAATASSYTVNSASSITASSPSGSGTVDVTVVSSAGTSATGASDQFTYVGAPVLTSFTASPVGYGSAGDGINAAAETGATNSPTSWQVATSAASAFGSTAQTGGNNTANVSIDGSGMVTYSAPNGFRGNDSFYIRAANSGGYSNVVAVTVPVGNPTLTISLAGSGAVGSPLSAVQVNASGGASPYSCNTAVVSGMLPPGTSLASSCAITGTPTAAGTYNFVVSVTDNSTGPGGASPFTQSSSTLALSIAPASQSISFTSTAPAAAQVGGSYAVSANASSGLPVSFTIDSASAVVCTISGTTVSFTGAGTCTINANQAGNGSYNAAPQAQQSFTVAAAIPSVTAVSPVSGPASGGTSVTISGANLAGVTAVRFGATVASIFVVNGPSSVTAVAPAASAGTVDILVTAPGGTSTTVPADQFTYIAAPIANPRTGIAIAYNSSGTAIDLSGSVSGTHTSLAVASPAGHGSTSVAGDVVTYTPASGYFGPDSFTYTATGPGGTSAPASVTLQVASPAAPVVAATSANVPYNGSAAINLSSSINGVHSSIAIASAAAHGTTSVSGDTVTYSSATGYYGPDSFSFSATGPGGTSAPATVSIAVATPAPPVAAPAAASVAYGVATPINLSPEISGVHNNVLVVASAAHGSTSISGDIVTYTPSAGYYGSDSFRYAASGPGGTSTPATVSVTITSPVLVITPSNLPSGEEDSAYSATVSASGGAAPYTYAMTSGALPQGIALSPTGTISGTPTVNGTFNVTISATDSSTGTGAASTSASYTLQITPPPPPTARNGSATVTEAASGSHSVDIDLTSLVSGNVTGVQIATAPLHGTVVVRASGSGGANARYTAIYTPTAGFQGQDHFTFVAVGPGGSSAAAQIDVMVVGIVPVATNLTATTGQNQPVTVDITAGATGAPFTQAAIISVTPAASATASLIAGGTATSRTYKLEVAPSPRFTGAIVVSYTLSNSFGMSAPATVTITVKGRPDPSQDSVVRALVDAEDTATREFARTQLDNFNRRAEQLHGGGGKSDPVGFGLSSPDAVRGTPLPGETGTADRQAGAEQGTTTRAASSTGTRKSGSVAIWTGGEITIGTRDAATRRTKLTLSTSGLSAGADIKLSGRLTLGAGGGVGEDRTRLGANNEGHLTADDWVAAIYGSFAPARGAFIDGVLGYGSIRFDTRRATPAGTTAIGRREGSMTFASLSGGIERSSGTLSYSGYGRLEYLNGKLSRYTELDAGLYDLTFDGRTVQSLTGVFGARAQLELGTVTPRARFEWRHEFDGASDQLLDYEDLGGAPFYRITNNDWLRNEFQLEVGLGLELGAGWRSGFDLGGQLGEGGRGASARVNVTKKF